MDFILYSDGLFAMQHVLIAITNRVFYCANACGFALNSTVKTFGVFIYAQL